MFSLNRIKPYLLSSSLIALLAFSLAVSPCGGWIIGFLLGLFIGMTLSAQLWLLPFSFWIRLPISLITAGLGCIGFFLIAKLVQIPAYSNIELGIDWTLSVLLFFALIELIRFLGKPNSYTSA